MDIQTSISTVPSVLSGTFNIPLFLVLIILVFLSSFFSMTETVFSSISESKLKTMVEERKPGAKKALYCADHFDRTLTTLLVGNNIVNVALSTFAVTFFAKLITGNVNIEIITTAIVTVVLLVFGEVTPKSIGKKYNDKLVLFLAPIIYVLSFILYPLVIVFMGIQRLFVGKKTQENQVNEDELETILDTMVEDGAIEDDEHELIKNVFDLNDRSVEDIMVPRVDMVAIDVDSTADEVKEIFVSEKFSRIPVYKEDKDHIVGILYERDFLTAYINNRNVSIKSLMRPAKFVNKTMKVDTLISTLQEAKMHMAIVSGEYNDTLGLVTMEDALEEIVGEIYDEHDEGSIKQKLINKVGENQYLVDGEAFVSDMFEELGIGTPPEDVSKVSTWFFESHDELPKVGDKMIYISCYTDEDEEGQYQDYQKKITLEIEKVDDRRIESLMVTVEDATNEDVEKYKDDNEE